MDERTNGQTNGQMQGRLLCLWLGVCYASQLGVCFASQLGVYCPTEPAENIFEDLLAVRMQLPKIFLKVFSSPNRPAENIFKNLDAVLPSLLKCSSQNKWAAASFC